MIVSHKKMCLGRSRRCKLTEKNFRGNYCAIISVNGRNSNASEGSVSCEGQASVRQILIFSCYVGNLVIQQSDLHNR